MSSQAAAIRVLLVEDNPGDVRLIREMLAEARDVRFVLEHTDRLATGLTRLAEENVDVLLLDLGLPDSVGFDTFATAHAQAPHVPIIVLSSLQEETVAIRAVREGAQDYLGKGETDGRLLTRSIRYAIEREREEQQLRLQAAALAAAANGIVITDRSGTILWVNPAFTAATGYAAEEAIGQNPRILRSGEHDQAFYQGLWQTILAGRVWRGEIVNRRKDGSLYTEEMTVTPVRDARGEIAHFVAIKQDVTERKRAEETLRHARAAEARLGRLLDESSDEIHVIDAETLRFVQTTAGTRRNLGYTEDELSRMTPVDLQSEYTAEDMAALLEPLRTGERDEFRIETHQRRKDGSTYPVEVRVQYVAAEQPPVFVTIAQDITERRRLEGQLLQAQKMEAIGQLTGGIAHDFNNLLMTISGYAQLLAGDLDPADERRADVARILDASDRAARLIRQLLAFSRRQVLHPEVLDLSPIVHGIDALLRPLIGDTIVLTVALDPDLGSVRADPSQLEQVIMNLVTNARDAMPSGGRLTIETANVILDSAYVASHPDAQPGPHVMLAVSDTGIGMDAATMGRLFEPFFTTKAPGKGTGLGLATTYGIVKQNGGSISVHSDPGRGTTFKIHLPLAEADGRAGEAVDRAVPDAPAGGAETILLVEDDAEVRALAETILARYGYTVLSAPDGRTALEVAASAGSIALLVTDVMMPGLRGPELAERLVALRPGLPVLYISGYAAEAVGNHDLLERGASYLEKPFTPEALARIVRRILHGPGPSLPSA